MSAPGPGRLFFACWPGDGQRRALAARLGALAGMAGRPVSPVDYHVTLRFLGATPEERRPVVERVGAAAAAQAQTLSLALDTVWWWERPRVLVFGASRVPRALADLVGALEAGARALGHPPEHRPYRPHLTLAREVRRAPDVEPPAPFEWHVATLALCESAPRPGGARYAVVAQWRLGDPGTRVAPVE